MTQWEIDFQSGYENSLIESLKDLPMLPFKKDI